MPINAKKVELEKIEISNKTFIKQRLNRKNRCNNYIGIWHFNTIDNLMYKLYLI